MTSFARWAAVTRRELSSALRRPSYWFLFGVLVLLAWGFSAGNVLISSGDATAGGQRSHITSVFAQTMFQSILITGVGAWFLAIGAGLVLIRDAEHRVGEVLHATRLTVREYVWGSFAGAVAAFLIIWWAYLAVSVGFNHVLTAGEAARHIGPFLPGNYLYPALLLGLPQIVFLAGVSFFLGAWTRRPIVVFAFPITVVVIVLGLLVSWSPSWLDPAINRALMLADPSGFRWLIETFLKLDRGVDFYNTAPLAPDTGFLLSRIALGAVGLLAVGAAARNTARRLPSGRRGFGGDRLPPGRKAEDAGDGRAGRAGLFRENPRRTRHADRPTGIPRGGARHRPGRSPGTARSAGHVSLRPPDPLGVGQSGSPRARTLRFAAAADFGERWRRGSSTPSACSSASCCCSTRWSRWRRNGPIDSPRSTGRRPSEPGPCSSARPRATSWWRRWSWARP